VAEECASTQPQTIWEFHTRRKASRGTELDFAIEVVDAVNESGSRKRQAVVINLPATVEMSTPNVYAGHGRAHVRAHGASQALPRQLHTHNDRGCGVAAAELGVLAGADRVEGTLLGNGERTGNRNLVTFAMNLYSRH